MRTLTLFLTLLINVVLVLSGTVYKVTGTNGSSLNIRSGPGTGNKIVGKLKPNELIFATSVSGGWAKFYKGYVSASYLTAASGPSTVKTTANLNFRTGPGTNYSKITTIGKGSGVSYYGRDPFTSGWAVTNKGYASASYLSGSGGSSGSGSSGSSGSSGNSGNKSSNLKKAENAADYARNHAYRTTQHYCARFVANALQNAGFKFKRNNAACEYHTKGTLKGMGFKNISKPGSFKKGDIAVHGCNKSHEWGHIQIYDGKKWYSDFAQNSLNVFGKNPPPIYYYRV